MSPESFNVIEWAGREQLRVDRGLTFAQAPAAWRALSEDERERYRRAMAEKVAATFRGNVGGAA